MSAASNRARARPLWDKFWEKVEFTGFCWTWTASVNNMGYGKITHQGKTILAHQTAYEFLIGPIPAGLELDHLCRVPICVNPDHLDPVTHQENLIRRGLVIKRCPRGHRYDDSNTRWVDNARDCRACDREKYREKHNVPKERWLVYT